MNIELAVDDIHPPGIKKDETNEAVYRALLCKPESRFIAAHLQAVKGLNQHDTEQEGDNKPEHKAAGN